MEQQIFIRLRFGGFLFFLLSGDLLLVTVYFFLMLLVLGFISQVWTTETVYKVVFLTKGRSCQRCLLSNWHLLVFCVCFFFFPLAYCLWLLPWSFQKEVHLLWAASVCTAWQWPHPKSVGDGVWGW